MLALCRALPASARTDSLLFLMQYSRLNPGDELDFFANYYSPIWSVLYWLRRGHALRTRITRQDMRNAVTAQSMAMFLHSLDDHLTDGQIPISPLTLFLRSQAWIVISRSFCKLAEGVPGGASTIVSYIDYYYSSSQYPEQPESLDTYCNFFRKQMAILMIAPVLLCMKMTAGLDFAKNIEIAYGSFGIAWRLLDDANDIFNDIEKGTQSSVYWCLPERLRYQWRKKHGSGTSVTELAKTILAYTFEYGLIEKIKKRICSELDTAASIVETHDITGLAREFRRLAHPLRNSGSTRGGK